MDMCRKSNWVVGRTMIYADVAQLAEQLICNQQVGSSSLPVSSTVSGGVRIESMGVSTNSLYGFQ